MLQRLGWPESHDCLKYPECPENPERPESVEYPEYEVGTTVRVRESQEWHGFHQFPECF